MPTTRGVEPTHTDLSLRQRADQVLPVVGASVSYDLVFAANQGRLAKSWAEKLDLPHHEGDPVCRVARYQVYRSGDDLQVKEGYLRFLKETLLNQAEASGVYFGIVEEAVALMGDLAFTRFANLFDYPKSDDLDPLRLLAYLPLPIYVTTSFHGLLQDALRREGREPRTAVFCWNDAAANLVLPEHRFDPDHLPTYRNPLVFHLYGYEEYPESLVLSEDDYLSFLKSIAQDPGKDTQDRAIPHVVLDAWKSSSLLCLGFRPESFEFKSLWLGLGLSSPDRSDHRGTFQCSDISEQEVIRQYIQQYLEDRDLDVSWGTSSDLLRTLIERWRQELESAYAD